LSEFILLSGNLNVPVPLLSGFVGSSLTAPLGFPNVAPPALLKWLEPSG
jgi:hypothetical protein